MATLAVLFYAVTLALFVTLHLRDGRDPVGRAVSDYANGPARRLFVVYGATGIAATLMLALSVWQVDGQLAVMLAALALLGVGLVLAPVDPGGQPQTLLGRLHILCATLSFALVLMITVRSAELAQTLGPAKFATAMRAATALAAVSLGAVIAGLFLGPARPFFGLSERAFLVATAAACAGPALRLSGLI